MLTDQFWSIPIILFFKVAPAELENVLRKHEKVADVAVTGVPDDKAGEVPKAFVVKEKGVHVSEKELMDFVGQKVSKHKNIKIIQFVDEIPKSAAGKILRRNLKHI